MNRKQLSEQKRKAYEIFIRKLTRKIYKPLPQGLTIKEREAIKIERRKAFRAERNNWKDSYKTKEQRVNEYRKKEKEVRRTLGQPKIRASAKSRFKKKSRKNSLRVTGLEYGSWIESGYTIGDIKAIQYSYRNTIAIVGLYGVITVKFNDKNEPVYTLRCWNPFRAGNFHRTIRNMDNNEIKMQINPKDLAKWSKVLLITKSLDDQLRYANFYLSYYPMHKQYNVIENTNYLGEF